MKSLRYAAIVYLLVTTGINMHAMSNNNNNNLLTGNNKSNSNNNANQSDDQKDPYSPLTQTLNREENKLQEQIVGLEKQKADLNSMVKNFQSALRVKICVSMGDDINQFETSLPMTDDSTDQLLTIHCSDCNTSYGLPTLYCDKCHDHTNTLSVVACSGKGKAETSEYLPVVACNKCDPKPCGVATCNDCKKSSCSPCIRGKLPDIFFVEAIFLAYHRTKQNFITPDDIRTIFCKQYEADAKAHRKCYDGVDEATPVIERRLECELLRLKSLNFKTTPENVKNIVTESLDTLPQGFLNESEKQAMIQNLPAHLLNDACSSEIKWRHELLIHKLYKNYLERRKGYHGV